MIKEYILGYLENKNQEEELRWLTLTNIFFIQTILSLSLSLSLSPIFCNFIAIILFFSPHFGNSIATNQLSQFFFPSISATKLPQISYYYFFFLSFRQFHCHKSIATIFFPSIFNQIFFFFPSFSTNSLTKLLLNFSPSFRQLGCHNSYFFSPHSPTISTTWLPQLVSF